MSLVIVVLRSDRQVGFDHPLLSNGQQPVIRVSLLRELLFEFEGHIPAVLALLNQGSPLSINHLLPVSVLFNLRPQLHHLLRLALEPFSCVTAFLSTSVQVLFGLVCRDQLLQSFYLFLLIEDFRGQLTTLKLVKLKAQITVLHVQRVMLLL